MNGFITFITQRPLRLEPFVFEVWTMHKSTYLVMKFNILLEEWKHRDYHIFQELKLLGKGTRMVLYFHNIYTTTKKKIMKENIQWPMK